MSLPSRRTSTVARIVTYDGDREEAFAPLAVTVTLADEIDASRGDMLVHAPDDGGSLPMPPGPAGSLPHVARSIEAMVVWMHETPLRAGASYLIKHGTKVVSAEVGAIHERVDVTTLERHPARSLGLNDIGRVTLTAARPLLFDAYAENRATGAFILVDRLTNGTFGAGMILGQGASEPGAVEAGGARGVTPAERLRRLGQKPSVVVLTGDDRTRVEEVAYGLERRLWDEGYTAHVLGAREVGALAVCQRLGLISIVLADGSTELSALTSVADPAGLLVVGCDAEAGEAAASVEGVVRDLRGRRVVR
jgi:bifunctional enzyme CysN/CysC